MSECRGRLGADLPGGFLPDWRFPDVDEVGGLIPD